MSGLRLAVLPFVALFAAGFVAPAASRAQDASLAPCRLCSGEGDSPLNARPATPLRLEVESRLDFDKVVFEGNGNALLALSPGGVARLTGAATAAGARAMPGAVVIRGEPGRAVRIDLPAHVELFGTGSGSLRIDSLVTDLSAFPRIGDDGTLSFRFGGDLRLSGEIEGAFRGTIDITVEYL
jgi:hypothetical protein